MPVIRLTATGTVLKREDREAMTGQLAQELQGQVTDSGPVIFEIPLSGGEKFDALVVWNKWKEMDVPAQTRSEMILDAYGDKKDKVALPLGVSYNEAIEQNLLPYSVVPMTRKSDIPVELLKAAMKKHGAFVLDNDKVELRLPTLAIAKQIHQKLVDELPKGYWSIVQTADAIE